MIRNVPWVGRGGSRRYVKVLSTVATGKTVPTARPELTTRARVRSNALSLDRELALRPWELKTLILKHAGRGNTEIRKTASIET